MSDVPTDAEYAMEMISIRVAAGLKIRPSRSSKGKQPFYAEPSPAFTANARSTLIEDQFDSKSERLKDIPVRVKGMEQAIDSGKSLFQVGRRFINKMQVRFRFMITPLRFSAYL
jgi:hypothetical protein